MIKRIYVAGGCFWGVEHFYKLALENIKTRVGYLNSVLDNPNYKMVCDGISDAVEAVEIEYDSSKYNLNKILDILFLIIDPTSVNKQGNDIGRQYRTGIYSNDINDLKLAKNYIGKIQHNYSKPIVVEVEKVDNFYEAEEYHQKYLEKNPSGYCHIDMSLIHKIKGK